MTVNVGQISDIYRFPVKSFAGERLENCEIEHYGMLGDRFCSFYDETKRDWFKYITARNIPNMLNYQARFNDGSIEVTAPDGRRFGWDEQLLAELQGQTKTRLTQSRIKAPNPEAKNVPLLSVEAASILLVTDASLKKLESLWGKPLDPRRFRGNFIVNLNDDAPVETEWVGQRITIGEVELQADSLCERCVVITMDPDTQQKDPSLLKLVNQEFGLMFGVYASVLKPGRIRLGDTVAIG
ncbi:MOSC domain-containing protein [Paenibacillus lycopersici]|uniref:MOSC domain-containing protein n=1 Tax=Paenibacillus lycopersici TaxID=2704462 RepID=A0A6C0G4V7_9BACL|nr:MOSC N-terminal beta barrel domain-containing protein [Paenibacillus lycopersici]QHT62494.1 MOSC domain-containing protein [Paenibacillus lycopersici]